MTNVNTKSSCHRGLVLSVVLLVNVFTSAMITGQKGYSIDALETTLKQFVTPELAEQNVRKQSKIIEEEGDSVAALRSEGMLIQKVRDNILTKASSCMLSRHPTLAALPFPSLFRTCGSESSPFPQICRSRGTC